MKSTICFIINLVLMILLVCSPFQYTHAQNISATQNPPVYNDGQVQYAVSGSSSGNYSIETSDKSPEQTLVNSSYNGGQISYSPSEPGVYFARLANGAFGSAVYKPFEIKTSSTEPADFDAYWSGVVNSLPPVIEQLSVQPQGNLMVGDLILDNIDGKKIYCKIAYPSNGSNMAGVLSIKAFSGDKNIASTDFISTLANQQNVIAVSISGVSEIPVGQTANPPVLGGEKPFLENRDGYYYKNSIAACYQVLNYIASRPDYSSSKGIALTGVSQGAGLSLLLGGVDAMNANRVKCLLVTQPILCDNSGILFNKASGYPNYIFYTPFLNSSNVAAAAAYYDVTHAAKRINDPVYMGIGYRDFTTHPAGNFAAFNELRGPVHLAHGVSTDHSHSINGFWSGALSKMFFERYLNGNNVTANGSTVYFVDAGADKTVAQGGTLTLTGTIDENNTQTPPNTSVEWSCIDCPNVPSFSNANAYTTTATFPTNGTYTLRFGPVSSTDNAARKLYIDSNDPNLYHTAADYMVVTVGGTPCAGQGGDNDNDGVCADVDCDDNDASVPAVPGTSCDDGDSNTNNDVIQADGCTCQGTTTPTGSCAIDLVSFTKTTDSSTSCDTYQLTMGSSAAQTTATTIQITDLPANGFSGNTAGVGTLSWAGQTAYNWNIPANSNGLHTATFKYCWATGTSAQATFNDGTCNDSVTVGGVACTDNDSDGVCADVDCDDNDSSVPAVPGTSCDDGDSNTNNDVIQADGCTCAGTIPPTGNCAIDLVSFTKTTDSSTSCDTYQLTMASSAAQTTAATIQITDLPANGFSGNTAGVGTLSWAGQTAYNWNIPANSNGLHTATFKYCWATGTSAQATFNDGTCNDSVTVGGVTCTDNDSDGVCADVDCDDNDSSVPAVPGTSCDDGNANTANDVIQADGCTCQGTTTPTGNCAIDLVSFTRTTDSDPNCDTYKLIMASSAVQTTDVTIQITNLPGNGYVGNTAGVGTLSWVGQTAYNWNIPANSNGLHLATFNYCWAADATAQATYDGTDCNETIVVNGGNKVTLNPDDISVFPNPAENETYLNLEALAGNQGTIAISNSLGQVVENITFDQIPSDLVRLDIGKYNNGLYFISIKTNDNQRIVKKLIINKFD